MAYFRYNREQVAINVRRKGVILAMGKPKKQSSPRKTGLRRSHLVLKLARKVNAKSPVKAYTTKRESGKKAAI